MNVNVSSKEEEKRDEDLLTRFSQGPYSGRGCSQSPDRLCLAVSAPFPHRNHTGIQPLQKQQNNEGQCALLRPKKVVSFL